MATLQQLFCIAFLAYLACMECKSLEGIGLVTSMKELSEEMYKEQKGAGGCYKLLNSSGPAGSQGHPDFNYDIDAPLLHYSDLPQQLERDVAVLLPVKQSITFMQQLQADSQLQQRVKGVLVDDTETPSSYSTVGSFPGAEYAPYTAPGYIWNKAAGANSYPSSTSWFPMPVFLLTEQLAVDAQQRATYNAKQDPARKQYHAKMKLTMASSTSVNSADCIDAGTCKPLGGYSIWSAMPPLPTGGSEAKPIILVVAQMDSIDMFHDSIQGADGPLSGLVAVLGALHALHATANSSSIYSKRLVFLALAGEPWGYMGSRRLLYEASLGSNSTAGLDMSLVEQVIEVGQVGHIPVAPTNAATNLYAHFQRDSRFGDASDVVAALQEAAQGEANAAKVEVQPADNSNPGIPPSTLMSFLRVNPSVKGVVLAEFDRGFTNPYYASRFDNCSTINADGIAATAAVLAAAVHRLAGGNPAAFQVNMTDLRQVVASYVSCIIMPVPGFACPLATSIMSPDYVYNKATGTKSYAPKNYVGVLQYMPGLQTPLGKSNLARFLWNVMAFDTSDGQLGDACDPFQQTCSAGQVCAGWRSSSDPQYMGKCVNATVQYVPSYSTRLVCDSCNEYWQAKWRLTDEADAWNQQHDWPPDPAWVESDWPYGMPDLQLYLHEARAVEVAILISGLAVTAGVAVASYAARTAFHKHHKHS